MMRMFWHILRRDLIRRMPGGRDGGAALPLLFFLCVVILYPFAVGPNARILEQTGGGILWVAALLASILPLERLVRGDIEGGIFDQFAVRDIAEETVLLARLVAHWISFAPLLLLACFPAAALLGLPAERLGSLLLSLLVGTPGLAAIGLLIACLTAGLKSASALGGILLIPLSVPLLIFGAGAYQTGEIAPLAFCASMSLVLCAIAPIAGAGAIRAARER